MTWGPEEFQKSSIFSVSVHHRGIEFIQIVQILYICRIYSLEQSGYDCTAFSLSTLILKGKAGSHTVVNSHTFKEQMVLLLQLLNVSFQLHLSPQF